jgi:hypothetical protein
MAENRKAQPALWELVEVEHAGSRVVLDLVGDAGVEQDRLLTISVEVEDDRDRQHLVSTTTRWKQDCEAIELMAVQLGAVTLVKMSAADGDGVTLTAVA